MRPLTPLAHLHAKLATSHVLPVGQSVSTVQPQALMGPFVTQVGLIGELAQSALVEQPQTPLLAHTGPRGAPAQSELVLHEPHRSVLVSQTGAKSSAGKGFAAQSALELQPWTQVPVPNGPVSWQPSPVGQSDLTLQPHTFAPPPGMGEVCVHRCPPEDVAQSPSIVQPHRPATESHVGPLALVVQSPAALQPQVCAVVSHAEPAGLFAQSASLTHSKHRPLPVSQAGWPGVVQSALDVQGEMQSPVPPGEPVALQTLPLGQSLVSEQRQTPMAPDPRPPLVSQTFPLDAVVQSAVEAHPQLPSMHAAPDALVAQSLAPRHCTQALVLGSHSGAYVLPAQSVLVTHCTHTEDAGSQTVGPGKFGLLQSALVVHFGAQTPATVSHAWLAPQSAIAVHPHALVVVLHALPFVLPAHWASVVQPTHAPLLVSQKWPRGSPAHSPSEEHFLMHIELPGPTEPTLHVEPEGQSLGCPHPHAIGLPGNGSFSHTLPLLDVAQSAFVAQAQL